MLDRVIARVCLLLTTVVLACSANPPEYNVSLRIEDGVLVRTLAWVPPKEDDRAVRDPNSVPLWESRAPKGDFPEKQMAELVKLYGAPGPDKSFTGRGTEFAADLGGSATIEQQASPLGTVYVYRERTRGTDQPLEFASHTQGALTSALALSEGWMSSELSAHPAAGAALDAWLRERVIPDAASWTIYSWLMTSQLIDEDEAIQRLQQFAVERGYVTLGDLPLSRNLDVVLPLLFRRALEQRKVAIDPDLEAALGRLASEDGISISLGVHIVRSDTFRSWYAKRYPADAPISERTIEALVRDDDSSPEAETTVTILGTYIGETHPEALAALGDLIALGIGPGSTGTIQMMLAVPEAPLATNGTWEPGAGQIRWRISMRDAPDLSSFAYARWTDPAHGYQTEHFGRTLLTGKRLADYVEWRAALGEDERKTWDGRVEILRPNAELRTRIEALRISDPPAASEDAEDRAPRGVTLLLEGFDAGAPPAP